MPSTHAEYASLDQASSTQAPTTTCTQAPTTTCTQAPSPCTLLVQRYEPCTACGACTGDIKAYKQPVDPATGIDLWRYAVLIGAYMEDVQSHYWSNPVRVEHVLEITSIIANSSDESVITTDRGNKIVARYTDEGFWLYW